MKRLTVLTAVGVSAVAACLWTGRRAEDGRAKRLGEIKAAVVRLVKEADRATDPRQEEEIRDRMRVLSAEAVRLTRDR